jgi:hypothetical protein
MLIVRGSPIHVRDNEIHVQENLISVVIDTDDSSQERGLGVH